MATQVEGHQGAESAVIWLIFIALLTLIPGVIVVGMTARQAAPRLGTARLVLAFPGFMSLFWSAVAGSDSVVLAAARIGLRPAVTGRLPASISAMTPISIAGGIYLAGHVVGLVLLGVALWRGRAVPAWAALTLAALQVLHFVFAVVVPTNPLDACAWGLTADGFTAAAARGSGARVMRRPAAPAQADVARPGAASRSL